ncbi:MAG: ROK family transcriptional regulator [Firmicutes bacterium]|nr:ROK family transcriptional regulator [Bacillota bacterium]
MRNRSRAALRGDNITQVRRRNRAMILELVLREPGTCRRDIVHKTGLTAAAVSDITRELINEGLVTEEAMEDRKVGRNPVGLAIVKDAALAIGGLVHRDHVVVGLSNLAGQIVFSRQMSADCASVEAAQSALVDLAKVAATYADDVGRPIVGMGVSIPGMVVPETGSVRYSSILDWQDVKLAERLQRNIFYPIVIDNDVRGMALARYWFQDQSHEQFVMVYVGRGIACCSLRNGSIWAGNSGAAGQIGHSILDPNGPKCACGQHGCFEAMVSDKRLVDMTAEAVQNGAISSIGLDELLAGRVDMDRIYAAIEDGDEAARAAYRTLSRYLGIGLSNLIKIYDPQAVIVAGDIFRASKFATDLMKKEMRSHFLSEQASPDILVDENPALPLLGSATLALDRLVFRPEVTTDGTP